MKNPSCVTRARSAWGRKRRRQGAADPFPSPSARPSTFRMPAVSEVCKHGLASGPGLCATAFAQYTVSLNAATTNPAFPRATAQPCRVATTVVAVLGIEPTSCWWASESRDTAWQILLSAPSNCTTGSCGFERATSARAMNYCALSASASSASPARCCGVFPRSPLG
jgi:hypothetical protein